LVSFGHSVITAPAFRSAAGNALAALLRPPPVCTTTSTMPSAGIAR
jgi:hypothetical protein